VFLNAAIPIQAASYEETVAQWTSYKDVAKWFDKYFTFDNERAKYAIRGEAVEVRTPEQTFKLRSGVCHDAAVFARDTLNRIDPNYDAKIVRIINLEGPPQHTVAAFTMDGKLYIMDYGAGNKWRAMKGIHGPYDSLQGYWEFLSSLHLPKFKVGRVFYWHVFDHK
jgi:hypothetical protein